MSTAKKKKNSLVPEKTGTQRMEAAMKRTNKTARKAAKERKAAAPDVAKTLHKEATEQPAATKLRISSAQKKKFMDLLTQLHEKISKQITFLATDSLSKTDNDEPRDDVTDDFDRDFALSLLSSEHDVRFEITQAIQRINEQTFGRCEQCGTTISTTRLEAIPFARMCITCQSSSEKDKTRYQPFGSTLADAGKATAGQSAGGSEE